MKQPQISWRKRRERIAVIFVCMVLLIKGVQLVNFLFEPKNDLLMQESTCPVPTGCVFNGSNSGNVVEMSYDSLHGNRAYRFLVALHDPDTDRIISLGIKEGKLGPKYESVDEMHSICEHSYRYYSINCGPGRVFVEVGSALGMVSLYAASRGMRVYAFDPLTPNIQRLDESVCLNGRRHCLESLAASSSSVQRTECSKPSDGWGSFAPENFSRFCNLIGAYTDRVGRMVESEPGNLAATMRGGGSVRAQVKMVTIHEAVRDSVIELLLLTCQGSEYEVRRFQSIICFPFTPRVQALLGALDRVRSGKIRNIIWRRHHMNQELDVKAKKITWLLMDSGYQFYNLEDSRRSPNFPPQPIPHEKVFPTLLFTASLLLTLGSGHGLRHAAA